METIGHHATLSFDQIEAEGPAARPLDFPPPKVRRGVRVNALVVHPTTGQRDILPGVIHRESYTNRGIGGDHDPRGRNTSSNTESVEHSKEHGKREQTNGSKKGSSEGDEIKSSYISKDDKGSTSISSSQQPSTRQDKDYNDKSSTSSANLRHESRQDDYIAYFPQRRLQDAIYGSVWACLVLRRHYGSAADDAARAAGVRPGDPCAPIVWEIVGRHVAIKMIEWSKVHQSRGRLLEDPVKEIAAMQLIGTQHPNVLGSMEVLQDDDFLFSIMPYARGGDLFGYVVRDTELRGGEGGMSEPVARYWFRQLLDVSKV